MLEGVFPLTLGSRVCKGTREVSHAETQDEQSLLGRNTVKVKRTTDKCTDLNSSVETARAVDFERLKVSCIVGFKPLAISNQTKLLF